MAYEVPAAHDRVGVKDPDTQCGEPLMNNQRILYEHGAKSIGYTTSKVLRFLTSLISWLTSEPTY